jgi:hypothetical protein
LVEARGGDIVNHAHRHRAFGLEHRMKQGVGVRLIEHGNEFVVGFDILGAPGPEIDGGLLGENRRHGEHSEKDKDRRFF